MTSIPVGLHDRNEAFRNNMQILPLYVKQQIENIDFDQLWKLIEVGISKEGYPICNYREEGCSLQVTSSNPLDQAEYWCNQLSLEQTGTLFVYGCGFGYPLVQLLKKMHKESQFIVFEQNRYIFAAMLHYINLEPFIRSGKFIFFVGNFEDYSNDFQQVISSQNIFYITAPSVVFTPGSRMFRKEYIDIQHHVFERLVLKVHSLGNSHMDTLIGFHNMIDNTGEVLENPYLSSLKDKFVNVPAFIVANGPSLDANIHELKKVGGKGLILCCHSAITPLMKHGIKPDAICVMERSEGPYYRYFENKEYPEDISLLALAVVDPRIFRLFAGPRIPIFRKLDSDNEFINRLIGDGSDLHVGASVAHLAYEAAVYMGANPIVFVGQDLAYGSDGVTHSRQSVYSDENMKDVVDQIKSTPVIFVESNDGKSIPSNETWYRYKSIFEQMIERNPQITVINASEGGAKINGTLCDKLTNVIAAYCQENLKYRLDTLINEMKRTMDVHTRKHKTNDLVNEFKKYIVVYRSLEQITLERRAMCEQFIEASEHAQSTDFQQRLRQEYECNCLYIGKFLSPRLHFGFFQQAILVGCRRLNELGLIGSTLKYRKAMKIHFEMFDHLHLICQSLVRNFQIAVEKISSK